MTVTADLFALAVTALTGNTSAKSNVFSVLDWPTWDGSYPCIYIHPPEEDKTSLGRGGAPQFNVVATLTVEGRFQSPAGGALDPFDQGAVVVETALSSLATEIEQALINYGPLTIQLQQFPFIRTRITTSAEGEQHIGNLVSQIGLEFYQGPEDFYQPSATTLDEISVTTDSVNIFDPSGTYSNSPFPSSVEPAPRTQGPDGRPEGYSQYNFSQE